MRNREEKRRAVRTQRASAADSQALRARARDRARSRPLRVVIACTMIIVTLAITILPCYAMSSGTITRDVFMAGSGAQSINIKSQYEQYELPYNPTIVGLNQSVLNGEQKAQANVWGNSLIVNSKIVFKDPVATLEEDSIDKTIPMFNFYPITPINVGNGVFDGIRIIKNPTSTTSYNIDVYFSQRNNFNDFLVYSARYRYNGTQWGFSGGWLAEGYKTIVPSGGTGATPWTDTDDVIWYYNWLKNSATFTTYAGSGDATGNTSPFRRTLNYTSTLAQKITQDHIKVNTSYQIKAWWQTGGKPLTITFKGQNTVIDNRHGHEYAIVNEFPDISTSTVRVVYNVRCTYFFNESTTEGEDNWVVYTAEKTHDTSAHGDFTLYPRVEQLFPEDFVKRIGGIIYDEWTTEIIFSGAVNSNLDLIITDHYFKGQARRAHEVAGFFDSFRRNFDSIVNIDYGSFGQFLSTSIGGFFDTKVFGSFSIGDILMAVVAIGMVVVFLKIFAGG